MEQFKNGISSEELCVLLENPSTLLLIDVRSSRTHTTENIRGSVNVCWSVLQWKRLTDGTRHVITLFSQKARKILEANTDGLTIVIYDQNSTTENIGSSINLIYENMISQIKCKKIRILNGGINDFQKKYPDMITTRSIGFPSILSSEISLPMHDKSLETQKRLPAITHVENKLYLGDAEGSSNRELIDKYNIRYIINVTPDYANHFESDPNFHYLRIPIKDTFNQNINTYFPSAIDFIEEANRKNVGVLVHCAAGISRSATIVLAYLMKTHKKSQDYTYQSLKKLRDISPNLDFMGYLLMWEKTIKITDDDS